MINEELKTYYLTKLDDLKTIKSNLVDQKYAGPLLLYCYEENYLDTDNIKIMFVGKETNGWNNQDISLESTIDHCIGLAKDTMSREYNKSRPFWNFIKKINETINPGKKLNFIWNNINKFGKYKDKEITGSGRGRASKKVLEQENEYFNVFITELEITKPDVVIFLTGPSYDKDIKKKLPNVRFEKCSDLKPRKFARVVHEKLPKKSFRVYHPQYLRLSRKEGKYIELLKEKINT